MRQVDFDARETEAREGRQHMHASETDLGDIVVRRSDGLLSSTCRGRRGAQYRWTACMLSAAAHLWQATRSKLVDRGSYTVNAIDLYHMWVVGRQRVVGVPCANDSSYLVTTGIYFCVLDLAL